MCTPVMLGIYSYMHGIFPIIISNAGIPSLHLPGALVYEIVDTKLVPSKEYTAVVVASTIAGNASTIVLFGEL